MSLKPTPFDPVPENTVRIARAAFPQGNPYLAIRDELGALWQDHDFAVVRRLPWLLLERELVATDLTFPQAAMPSRKYITPQQVKLFMALREEGLTQQTAAAKASFSVRSAHRIEGLQNRANLGVLSAFGDPGGVRENSGANAHP